VVKGSDGCHCKKGEQEVVFALTVVGERSKAREGHENKNRWTYRRIGRGVGVDEEYRRGGLVATENGENVKREHRVGHITIEEVERAGGLTTSEELKRTFDLGGVSGT